MIDPHNIHGGIVFGRTRDNNLLGAAPEMSATLLRCCEGTSGFADRVSACLAPVELGGISLIEDVDKVTIYF